jgi:uncharacterized lipoprotein YddW (UPF0748 family)
MNLKSSSSLILGLNAFLLLAASVCTSAQVRSPNFAHALATDLSLRGRVMWVDGSANIDRITTREGVQDIVFHCKKAGFSTIVVDVKPVVGQVLYNSRLTEHLRQWKGKTYPDFDALAAFIEEGHKAGIEIAASLNVFSEGHKYFNIGLAYKNREWQSIAYNVDRSFVASDGARLSIRGETEPDEPKKTVVHDDEFVLQGSRTSGEKLAVCLDVSGRVEGLIDPVLLSGEPQAAPEDGHMMILNSDALNWAVQHVHAGDRAKFIASGIRVPVADAATEKVAAFVNPLHPMARSHELALLQEVASNYAVDAIVFDRMRFANLYNDYSDLTRNAFEKWLGKPVTRWPEDVISFDPSPGGDLQKGRFYKLWIHFRASIIRDFLREATDALRRIKPGLHFGVYVGSWFSEYFGVGVNWGSEKFPVRFSWAREDYNETGYAEFLDWVSTGCYYPFPTREDAKAAHRDEGGSVEAAADLSVAAVQNAVPVYAGVYALDYDKRPAEFARAIEVALKRTQGVMIFDLSYIYEYGWWDVLEKALVAESIAPHRIPDLNSQMRAVQDAIK